MFAIGRVHQPIVWSSFGRRGPGGSFGCIRSPLVAEVTHLPVDVCALGHIGLARRSLVTMIAMGVLVSTQLHIRLRGGDIARHRAALSLGVICRLAVARAPERGVAGGHRHAAAVPATRLSLDAPPWLYGPVRRGNGPQDRA